MSTGSSPKIGIHQAVARVTAVQPYTPGTIHLRLAFEEGGSSGGATTDRSGPEEAVAYLALVGTPAVGDRVLVNTSAVDLRLGTGGYHFVVAILEGESAGGSRANPLPGRGMKLRYTPHQLAVRIAESEDASFAEIASGEDDLDQAPVIACELHSQMAAAAAGFVARQPDARVVYVMTGGACLALPFSRLVPVLRQKEILHATITAGQSFGGDLEAINVYSALLLARHALKADLIVVGQGPGNAGTGSRFGFSGVEQGEAANAAASLGGRPVVCVRASAADPRQRHQSPSHHTLTVLGRIVRCRCVVPVARDAPGSRRRSILEAFRDLRITERHDIMEESRGGAGLDLLQARQVEVTTMGRSMDEDREFFLHAAAAGDAAASLIEMRG